jgi:hypothetical protein
MWFEPLFAELSRRRIPFEKILATQHHFDPADRNRPYSLVLNRMSPSAWQRGNGHAIFHSLRYLAYLDEIGVPVVNGHGPFSIEISKAQQLSLFERLGVRYPAARVINHPAQAPTAGQGLRFPVLVKPNIGGSGAGIQSFETKGELSDAARAGAFDLGPDQTALVQELLPAEGDQIVRVEFLDGRLLYAIRILLLPGSFNLCPADYCELPGVADGVSGRGLPIERYEPPADVVSDAKRILDAAGADLGGVEYLVSARDGLPHFYDVNVLSNFVADAEDLLGFDPFVNLVDLIEQRADSAVISAA